MKKAQPEKAAAVLYQLRSIVQGVNEVRWSMSCDASGPFNVL